MTSLPLVPLRRLGVGGAGVGAVAVAAAGAGLTLTGGASAGLLADPGAATRWGLPVARTVFDLTATLTVGLLVLAAVALPSAGGSSTRTAQGALALRATVLTAVRTAAVVAALWATSGVVVVVLSYAQAAGVAPSDPQFAGQLGQFVTSVPLLRSLAISTAVAAVVSAGALLATRVTTAGWLALLALGALLPVALTGHAAGSTDHELAVDSLAIHLVAVSVWVGALAALVVLRGHLTTSTGTVARRYSTLALWSFVLVAGSGAVNAWLRVGSFAHLATGYGALVLAKTLALVLLGAAGWLHRRRTLHRLDDESQVARHFWQLVVAELVVMATAVGLAVALSASAPPQDDRLGSAQVLALTGYPAPPPPTVTTWLTAWRVDLLWLTVATVLAGLYLAGAVRMQRRGDGWPAVRTVSWLAGTLALVYATSGAPAVYGRVQFSQHMFGHMLMSMVVPPLLVLGAPVTLAVRALPRRRDGSRGPREWVLEVAHSRLLSLLGHPLVAAVLFTTSLIAFYYSNLFELSLRTHTGHVLMNAHFLLVGYLFASTLVGVDPGPRRPAYPMRLVTLFATMAFHAFFAVALLSSSQLLGGDVLGGVDLGWGRNALDDQRFGGAVAWGVGELPTFLLGIGITIAWVRSDDREARRRDRTADRDGDAELAAYNAGLARLAGREKERA